MKRFDYYEPSTIEEACRLLSGIDGTVWILAGGTDLIPKMKTSLLRPGSIVNIKQISGLRFIKEDRGAGVSIGALTLISELVAHPLLKEKLPIIPASAACIGSVQVRNLATLGGNVCNAAPSADMAPALLAMDCTVSVAGPSGKREMALSDFFIGPGKVNLKRGELLTGVHIPPPPLNTKQAYLKHSVRRAMDIAIVGVAVSLSLEEGSGFCRKARIALGAVAPTPVRAVKAEEIILGKRIGEISCDQVAEAVCHETSPISDVRGSAGYRSAMVSTLTIRALKCLQALERSTDEKRAPI